MKLWEIKAQSLRIMFADSDIQFSEEEFTNGSIYENPNTRDKLVRMEDTIRRAIDMYYQYAGEPTKIGTFNLKTVDNIYTNIVDVSTDNLFGFPTRVDIYLYDTVTDESGNETKKLMKTINQVNYTYDNLSKQIFFFDIDYSGYEDNIAFMIWYKIKKINLPLILNELTYDLDDIYVPEEVQRMIPYFVKGELYEEDEPSVAVNSKNEYIQFLLGLKKQFSKVQTKVKRAKVFDK